jgi:ABC-type uncharacterized transport system involved in gliding motility auxiliary subunit
MKQKSLYSGVALALLAVLFIGLVMLSGTLLKGMRVDLTENQQYTLSEGTRNVLGSLEEPVTLHFFFSEQASSELPQIRSYARWVGEMLEEMASHSNGLLTVRRIDPAPFSPEEDQAARFGLQSVPVGTAGDPLYFGLAGTNSLDDMQAMPFLQPGKQQFFEYDLAKMVASLAQPEPSTVGLLSGLDIGPGFDMTTRQARPPWVIYEQLEQLFTIETIDNTAQSLPDGLDLLMLVHPRGLSEALRYEVDQFALAGGKLVVFVDPFAEADLGGDPSDPMARLDAGSASELGDLLAAWGVAFDNTRVVGDQLYALQVNSAQGGRPVRHLGILQVGRASMNQQDIISADLEAVNLSSSGWLEARPGAGTRIEPLLTSSENAAPIDASRLRFLSNPADLQGGFVPTGDQYVLVARVTGPAQSAFATPPEGYSPEQHLAASGDAGINLVLFADTDILTDRLWVQRQNFFGQTVVNSFADNGTLAVNAVDNLLGSADLISIRTRNTSARPFARVEQLRLEAESQFLATEERLNAELAETERTLSEMQAARSGDDLAVLNADQQQEIDRFIQQRIEIRSELRQVRLQLDREINALGTRLKVLNIVLVPALVVLVALLLGRARRRRAERGRL